MTRIGRVAGLGLWLGVGLAGCSSTSSDEGGGSTLRNLLMFGGPTVPPAAASVGTETYCPPVGVIEGGAALQAYAGRPGDPNALRNQISLSNFARECIGRPDGSTVVKVGVEGRALLGPSASAGGRFEAPVRVVIKSGDRVIANRFRRVPVAVPAGDTQGSFVVVEEDMVVPPGSGEFEIEVGLGGSDRPAARRRASR